MNARTKLIAVTMLAVVVGMAGVAGTAEASRPVDGKVTGTVTDVRGGDTIYVAGKPYKIQPNSAAARVLSQIHTGTVVDVVLSGAAGDPASRVIGIMPHARP